MPQTTKREILWCMQTAGGKPSQRLMSICSIALTMASGFGRGSMHYCSDIDGQTAQRSAPSIRSSRYRQGWPCCSQPDLLPRVAVGRGAARAANVGRSQSATIQSTSRHRSHRKLPRFRHRQLLQFQYPWCPRSERVSAHRSTCARAADKVCGRRFVRSQVSAAERRKLCTEAESFQYVTCRDRELSRAVCGFVRCSYISNPSAWRWPAQSCALSLRTLANVRSIGAFPASNASTMLGAKWAQRNKRLT